MQTNDEMIGNPKVMALGFSYTDEIDENYEDSGEEDDFESLDDNTLNKFDDDLYDDTLDEDDVNVTYDSDYNDYDDDLSEDYTDSEES